ncbi:hypothetical protein BDV3_002179 [Batrachochytrium dendrobatidis]
MSYGKATMPFISEATGVEDENQVWENIPVDTTVEASPEFVELFKKNCSVFEFGAEASRRTLIFFFGKKLPHLVAIGAKVTNNETLLQCIGECASIHYRRKKAEMRNLQVYGIHSTGSIWKFVFIDENGSLFVSKEYQLNPENYVKEGFDLIYRLVYYVVKQSHINSPRTTPAGSSVSINQ